jgi:nucleoside-diphosphate-sugar epimerase
LIAPESGYAVAKRSAEIYLKNFYNDFKISCIAVRLFNVYGPRQDTRMVVSRFIQNALVNKPIYIYGDGKQTRDFTYVDDCVKVFDLIAKKANGFHILNSSWGKDHSIIFLANKIIKILKSKSKIIKIKVPKKLQEFQVQKRCADSSLLNKIIGYKPVIDFETGLKKTILNIVKTTKI